MRLAIVLFFCVSCSFSRTQVVVTVDGDSVVRRDATHVSVRVTSGDPASEKLLFERRFERGATGLAELFPLELALASRTGNARFTVVLRADKVERIGNTTVTTILATNRARSSFLPGKVARLPLWLLSGCRCSENQSCVPGPGFVPTCVSIDVPPMVDVPDAAVDSRWMDGGVDGAPNNECEQGFHRCGTACVANGEVTSCGQRCEVCPGVSGGTAVCEGGACAVRCNGVTEMCGAACLDVSANANHCGRCDRTCAAQQICRSGACVEPPQCDVLDPRSCPSGSWCNSGRCTSGCDDDEDCGALGVCNRGSHECGCMGNAMRCNGTCAVCPEGASSTRCNAQNQCVAASCNAPQILCGGSCTQESVSACGAGCAMCSVQNGSAGCVQGSCGVAACASGYLQCQGQCAACPNAVTVTCSGSLCVASSCRAGEAFCNGQCVPETATQCGARCERCETANGAALCTHGSCGVASCNDGYLQCDGQCTACPGNATQTSCRGARCVATACAPGFALCDGRCVAESASQCGASCIPCSASNGSSVCNAGQCTLSSCNAGYLRCGGSCSLCPRGPAIFPATHRTNVSPTHAILVSHCVVAHASRKARHGAALRVVIVR